MLEGTGWIMLFLTLKSGFGEGNSSLIVGFTNSGKPVHVVCGLNENSLVIITVYIPGPPKFKNPYERG